MRPRIKRGAKQKEEILEKKETKPKKVVKKKIAVKKAQPVTDIMDDFKPEITDDITDEQIDLELKKIKIRYENSE